MSKSHINKHGEPAPCKTTKGNCPLGGDDQHFNSEKEAQTFINNQMESKHGLLGRTPSVPAVKNVTINHNFDDVFEDSWNNRGIQETGLGSFTLEYAVRHRENEGSQEKGLRDLYEKIKDDAYKIAKENGDSEFYLIPEKNMESEMRNNVLFPGEARNGKEEEPKDGWVTYNELKDSAIKHFGRDAIRDAIGSERYDGDNFINEDLNNELIKFGAKRMKEDSQFNINGQSVYLYSHNGFGLFGINWVDEYAKAVKNGTEKSKLKVISED